MFKTKVSYSTNNDPYQNGVEIANNSSIIGNVKLGMVFTNADMDQEKILEGIKSVYGNKPIIGCTSGGGIIVKEGIISGASYAGMMSFSDNDLIVGVAGSKAGENPREIGKKIARDAINNAGIKRVPTYFYMVSSPKDEEEYLKGIEDVIGTVPMFGGSAADNNIKGNWKIICKDEIYTDGCAVAFFYAKNSLKTEFNGYYEETANAGIITKINDKRTLMDIDRNPALPTYSKWVGEVPENLIGHKLLLKSILYPLGIKEPLGRLTIIKHLLIGNQDYSIKVGSDVTIGTGVIQMETSVDGLINSISTGLTKLNQKVKEETSGYLLFYSAFRKLGIGNRANEIYDEIIKVTDGKEFLMAFTFSEFGSNDHSGNMCSNLMLSFNSFSR